MASDYYDILGISKGATDDELKKAFRTKVKQYHPDLHPGDAEAEAKFKEVNEAYSVLSDKDKRARYDQFGKAGVDGNAGYGGAGGFGGFSGAGFEDIDLGDIFGSFFGGGRSSGRRRNGPSQGANLKYGMTLEFMEAAFGCEKDITISKQDKCSACNGSGSQPGTTPETCPQCKGAGRIQEQMQSLFGMTMVTKTCPMCQGKGTVIKTPCSACRGKGRVQTSKKLHIRVPAGVDAGDMLPVKGEGEPGTNGGPYGDLYVQFRVRKDDLFSRDGMNTFCDVPVTYAQAALGADIDIPTIYGNEKFKLKEGTQPGETYTIHGKGIPNKNNPNMKGDHTCRFVIEVPTGLSREQKQKLAEFNDMLSDRNYSKRSLFMQRVKNLFK
ncbi:MAG: molecular chaperone DnaJ [Saccharofermentans sp.]|nr:molecular chaperone DnaJ [Mageeibacillus sp.]MCI1263622.1 molecular chaperone DnaJ [Saccharofermentans sp.]MCI1275829.1 molecular chaperone DnaJ [Saccharofermentans sp.]MCI1769367.1 molecular chaperone DnaJ [Mageeibacillus sp.]MCI2044472.1 molecular chaperone DnaJ [Mageeibacillus sp.]